MEHLSKKRKWKNTNLYSNTKYHETFTILFVEPSETIKIHLSIHTFFDIASIATHNRNVLILTATDFQFSISKFDSNTSEGLH